MQVRTATLLFVILLIVAVLVYLDGVKKTDLRTHMWTWGGVFFGIAYDYYIGTRNISDEVIQSRRFTVDR